MIQFILNNERIQTTAHAGITLLDFIREHQQLKGTKIGCREGDCGACTVLVGALNKNTISYQSITSCISPLGNANGKHIVTIEGINIPKTLNTAQQAMADNYATQCGFCTPGFVVSMTGFALSTQDNNTALNSCNDAISGNICRCTGYKSIEKAGFDLVEKLQEKDKNHQIDWLINQGFVPDYFNTIPEQLKKLQQSTIQQQRSEGSTVANGTDLYVQHADTLSEEPVSLISDNTSLKGISFTDTTCTIGANTTVSELLENEQLRKGFPRLKSFLKLISSEQIRNMGTLGGNFVNASPIGDMSVFFLALNSTLAILHKNGTTRQIPFHKFHQDYKKYDLQKEEILKSIAFNVLEATSVFNFEKVSKRTHLDIASVNASARISVENNRIISAHFAVGGVAAIPKYAVKTAEFIIGKSINSEVIKAAQEILQSEISPISDVRGSATYKRFLARQLFFAHFIELFPTKINPQQLIAI
ncbi:MAG: FAD binding domain-containing protein [Polaribacter sp.]|nr:FAD binding domain-containing protein [Polaribacter sp.]